MKIKHNVPQKMIQMEHHAPVVQFQTPAMENIDHEEIQLVEIA